MMIYGIDPRVTLEHLGDLPKFLIENDPRPAKEQFDERYAFGGGWQPIPNFRMDGTTLKYPGDPELTPIAAIEFRDELILIYVASIICIVQPDGSFEVARMD